MKLFAIFLTAVVTVNSVVAVAADTTLIDAMDSVSFRLPKEKGKAEPVAGRVGKAVKFTFDDDCRNVFFQAAAGGNKAWDEAAGFSFWLKGDGSDRLGGMEFMWNDDFSIRYAYAFPLKNTEWHKVTVSWSDLAPEVSKADAKPIDAKTGNAPSKLGPMWLGKWWYWRDYRGHSYAIDDLRLETKIDRDTKDLRPTSDPTARTRAKLNKGQPIKIVTMGDSLTDYAHWANRTTAWPKLLAAKLKERYKSDVTIVNPAIGGTELRQNLVLVPGWAAEHADADVVIIFFGGNDWNSGMRGPLWREVCADAIARVRAATGGNADVLLLSTCPQVEKWDEFDELRQAAVRAANQEKAAFVDVYESFMEAGKTNKARLFVDDKVHLSAAGHELVMWQVVDILTTKAK